MTTHERALGAVEQRRARVGLVIGSGGIKCVAALGLWRALAREGIDVDVCVGCSGGAIYAAAYALGFQVDDVIADCPRTWDGVFSKLHWRSMLRAALPSVLGYDDRIGLVDDRRVGAILRETFGTRTFGDTRVPLFIAATDFHTGQKVVLDQGALFDAIRASVAIPLVLPPWPVAGRLLVDGGASNPLPIDVAIRERCDLILAMGFESTYLGRMRSLGESVGQATSIVTNHLIRSTFAFYSMAHHAEVIPIVPGFDREIGMTSVAEIPYMIRRGEEAAQEHLPYLRRLLLHTNAPSAASTADRSIADLMGGAP